MAETFDALIREAVAFRDARDWQVFHRPKDLALGLTIEAGELAELFLWKNDLEVETALQDPSFRDRLEEEIADVQIFLLYLADAAGLDLPQAVRAKIRRNGEKYPVEKSRGTSRKYTEL